jgi:transglutaminase-like putative cysteine protease
MTRHTIRHATVYLYERPMTSSQMTACLIPRGTQFQTVVSSAISCSPVAAHQHTRIDVFGNLSTYLSIETPHDRLEIVADSVVESQRAPLPDDTQWETVAEQLATDTTDDGQLARWCRLDSPLVAVTAELAAYAQPSFPPGVGVIEGLRHLTHRIFTDFTFDANATDVATPLGDVLATRRGVCQDFAHLAVGCLRSMGLPARYVSGYIETEPPPGQPRLVGADASHAWCSVFVPGGGWVDADPTNDVVPPTRHVTVAWGRDYHDIAPVRGITFGPPSNQVLLVSVDVARAD